jgi:hypothetical protein
MTPMFGGAARAALVDANWAEDINNALHSDTAAARPRQALTKASGGTA